MPTIYVIAGCNGAGKTTFAMQFLAREAKSRRFLNADEIARGLSPLDPASEALRAGRLLLEEFRSLVGKGESFAIESTLSGKTYVRLLNDANCAATRSKSIISGCLTPVRLCSALKREFSLVDITFLILTSSAGLLGVSRI